MTKNNQKGQILLLTIVSLGIVLFTVLFLIGGAQIYFQNAQYSANAEKALALAEAGVDKALNSLNKTSGSYNGEVETVLGDGSYSVEVINKDAGNKILQVTGYVPHKAAPKAKRVISIQASKGVGVAFTYGLQVGSGGLTIGTGSTINGSVYSNGSITGQNNANFTGDVYIAGAGQATADQQSDCFGANCQDYIFGRGIEGESRRDVAQSFRLLTDGLLNKASLKLKKVGFPANLTVRIMADENGKPDKNGVLATGTLSANLVTDQYDFVDVMFNSTPNLSSQNTYWIMIHSASLDNSNYWVWSLDIAQGYTPGAPAWSPNWQVGNPSWNTISGDLGFEAYLGGAATTLNLGSNSIINGNVHANAILGNMTVSGDAYYQTLGSSVVVQGTKNPGSDDPVPIAFPISDANISSWKSQTAALGVTYEEISACVTTLGPGKIDANVSFGNSCNVKVISPVWITGDLETGNSTKLTLDSSFGIASGMIIVDGITTFGNGSDLLGSGTEGSYLMLLSAYDSRASGTAAIDTGNSAISISGILYAPFGKVDLANGADLKEISAWGINLGNETVLNYQSGFASTFFSSGPSGSFSLVKGTYQVK